ncbi:MAG: SEL1-like repeat protein [Gammaproteobacteria bacterium]|nr:SEL1-like repeat protein [Gammaproteobacteria bacterium]MBU1415297.1 SEL1-like repeat protein [Gammaproteobacteria bacterium]
MRTSIVVISCVLLSANAALAQDCKDGLAAYATEDYPKAVTIFQPLAAKGDDCAQYQLGEMYMQGKGVPQDKARALELFKKAAAQGNQKAKLMAGFLERK